MMEPLLTVEEVADVVRMSPSWVKSEIRAGRLRQTKLGKMVRIEPSDLRAYIDEQKRKSAVVETVETLRISQDFDVDAAIAKVAETKGE